IVLEHPKQESQLKLLLYTTSMSWRHLARRYAARSLSITCLSPLTEQRFFTEALVLREQRVTVHLQPWSVQSRLLACRRPILARSDMTTARRRFQLRQSQSKVRSYFNV